jgi:hypothetical protein
VIVKDAVRVGRPDDRRLPILRAIRFLVLKATNPPSRDIVALFTDLAMETAPALSLSDDSSV